MKHGDVINGVVIDDIIGLALCAFFLRSMKNRGYDLYKGLDAFNKGDTKTAAVLRSEGS